ncbi:MAG: glucuronate isomerase [Cytophagales bacterium]|nr:glucuronate isomerase [Cytophagales bacterium]MDW8384615.1 glucuronate isomerase [Flammeovirgaceae bacterium]
MKKFLDDNFLLENKTAEILYHEYAKKMPIIDYHSHLPAQEIAEDKQFDNITQIWLYGDHYKWRAMRTNGVPEKYCTGDASDYEKFEKWAETVPYTLRNPLYHWTHMELKNPFKIEKILNPTSAKEIYEETSALLKTPEFSVRNLLRKFNVKIVCTTDDPCDTLEYHAKIKQDSFEIKVLPTFRPDKAMAVEDAKKFNEWVNRLEEVTNITIRDYKSFLDALQKRHDYFHEMGCRLSDHGVEELYAEPYQEWEIENIFGTIRRGKELFNSEILKFKSAMLHFFGVLDHSKGWTQQFHIGALRNNNTRMMQTLGPDTGFDSIGDFTLAKNMARFFDRLDDHNQLAKTIIYNLNPSDNEVFATMIGNFNDGSIAGKMQFGPAWWFLDQKDGMIKQMNALSNLGLLRRFVGMVTDSRSFLSYSRHEYFRRILCNLIGTDVENGELPNDIELLADTVKDICFQNADQYFQF